MKKVYEWLALLLVFCVPASSLLAEEWRYSGIDRIVALSDIHGAYDAFVATLQSAGIVDEDNAWSGGETHLIITGDLVDRGADSRQVMDLVMRLESEAPGAGGQVHLTLGNHEVMNLIGDLRYVADAEYAAFSDEESGAEREQWYQRFRRSQPAEADEDEVRSAFNELAPPGFFGHRQAFKSDGVYGKWLLEKPLMIVANDTAFVHGGIPPYVAEHGLADVNLRLKADLLGYLDGRSRLEDAGILSPTDGFKELPSILSTIIEAGQLDDAMLATARAVLEHKESPLHGPAGPLWYRGSSVCSDLIERDELDAALSRVGAKRAAIGHTTTVTRQVQQRMNGRILEINTGILESVYEGRGYALVIESNSLSIISELGETDLSPTIAPRRVGYESRATDDDALADILSNGAVIDTAWDDGAWRLVRVESGPEAVLAYFNALPKNKTFAPELAAYRLDRMLGLDMVPVTVRREIAGIKGTLQFVPAATMSERSRLADGMGDNVPCSLEKQWRAMRIFDALIHNPSRTPLSMLYSPDNWQLMLVNHENSFGTQNDRPAYLGNIELTVGDHWRGALLELDDARLRKKLGDVLDKRRLRALAKRRDSLIELSSR